MHTKLTLRMDESLIASAKDYAAAHGSSVSQMVANYFAALAQAPTPGMEVSPSLAQTPSLTFASAPGPITQRLTGLLKPPTGQSQVSEKDYHAYLEHKYLGAPLDTLEEKSR